MKIINFSNVSGSTNSKLNFYAQRLVERFSKPINSSKEYRFTQFISDEIRKCGVDGICYTSYFTQSPNYVIFNCSTTSIKFMDSKILKLYSQQLNFIDYSFEKMRVTKVPDILSNEEILKEKIEIYNLIKLRSDFDQNQEENNNR